MGRYLRLWAHFVRFSFARAMEFRLDFFFRVGMDALWNAMNLAFFAILYLHTDRLGGWDRDQMRVFLGGVFLADAVQMTVTANNVWAFPYAVNHGELDYHLVRPVSTLFFVSVRDFAANSFLNLLLAAGILAWALASYPAPLPAPAVAGYVALLLVGVFLGWCLQMICLVPVFWMHSGSGLRELFMALETYSNRPVGIFTGFVRRLLVSVLPLALVISFPTRALFEGFPLEVVLHVLLVAAAAFALLRWLWKKGLAAYSSASS